MTIIYLYHVVEEAEPQSLFENPRYPYTQALLAAIPVVDKAGHRERVILYRLGASAFCKWFSDLRTNEAEK